MIKVLIVVSGLVLFVPDAPPDPKGLTALLVETRFTPGMTRHFPAVRQQLDRRSFRGWFVPNEDFRAVFKVAINEQPSIGLSAETDFPQLKDLTPAPDDARINPACLAGNCTDGQLNPLVAAIVRFEGGWRTRPVQRCERAWILPVDFNEKAQSDFRKGSNLRAAFRSVPQRPLATGLAIETEVEKLENLHFEIGGTPQQLQLSDQETCRNWLGQSVPSCVVLEVENWPILQVDPMCNGDDPPDFCRVDHHFGVFYNLIAKPPPEEDRLLPFVAAGTVKCPNSPGAGNPPAVRCPPTFAEPVHP